MIAGGRVNTSNWGTDIRFYTHPESTSNVHETYERMKINSSGHLVPAATNTYDLGASGLRWRNVYTTDLQLSNEGKTNDVDGTWGNYTIQEGESDLFLINNRNGKKYKFNLTEVS